MYPKVNGAHRLVLEVNFLRGKCYFMFSFLIQTFDLFPVINFYVLFISLN